MFNQIDETKPAANSSADINPHPAPTPLPTHASQVKVRWGIVAIIVVLVLGGGGYLAFSQGWVRLSFANTSNTSANTNQIAQVVNTNNATASTNQAAGTPNTNTQVADANTNVSTNTNLSGNTNVSSAFEQMPEIDRLGSCYLTQHHEAIAYYAEDLRSAYQGYVDYPQPVSLCAGFTAEQLTQAGIDIGTDADHDGLNLLLERVYGSSDTSADTDGDSYSDLQEINNGYDPNGPGLFIDRL